MGSGLTEKPLSWAVNSWAWSAWANNAWGGWTVEYEYKTELQDGAPDRGGRSRGGRTVRSRYADDVFAIDRVPAKYEVRPANWRAPWQKDGPTPVADRSAPSTYAADVSKSVPETDTSTPQARIPPTVTVSQSELLAAKQAVDRAVTLAKQAVDDLMQQREDALAIATAMLLLLDDDSY